MNNQLEVYTDKLTDWIQEINMPTGMKTRENVHEYLSGLTKNKRKSFYNTINKNQFIQLYKNMYNNYKRERNLRTRRKAEFEAKLPMWQELNRQEKSRMAKRNAEENERKRTTPLKPNRSTRKVVNTTSPLYKEYIAQLQEANQRRRERLAAEAEAEAEAEEAAYAPKKKRTWIQRIRNAVTFKRRGGKRSLTRRNRNKTRQ